MSQRVGNGYLPFAINYSWFKKYSIRIKYYQSKDNNKLDHNFERPILITKWNLSCVKYECTVYLQSEISLHLNAFIIEKSIL